MIPLAKPSITDLEKEYVSKVMEEGFISSGSWVKNFEDAWSIKNKYDYGVACTSGTVAMYLALLALDTGPGDEVIVPEFTMAATAWAVTYTGAKPVFVDCGDDLNIDVTKIEEAMTARTKAIMPVHVYGRQCNMEAIQFIAKKKGIFIVEDMAEAHGIQPVGDIACYSFQGNKILTTGEGGMCLTNDDFYEEEMRRLSTLYFDRERSLIHEKVGYNMKMTNLQAAIGLAQVERFDEIYAKRLAIQHYYEEKIKEAGLKEILMPSRDTLWMFDVNFSSEYVRDGVKDYLTKKGIETRFYFKPMSQQPMYRKDMEFMKMKSYRMSKTGLYLPTFTDMTKEDINTVASTLREAMVQLD